MPNDTKYDTLSNVGYCAIEVTNCMNTLEQQLLCTPVWKHATQI